VKRIALPERFDSEKLFAILSELPVRFELGLVEIYPGLNQMTLHRRKLALDLFAAEIIDDFLAAIIGVEVRRKMVVVEHPEMIP
jgi:hypothetical protein